MNAKEPTPAFELRVSYDQKELLGARWWQANLAMARLERRRAGADGADASRRDALKMLGVLGGVVVVGSVITGVYGARRGGQAFELPPRKSLELQKEQGLAVGASSPTFVYPDAVAVTASGAPFEPAWLSTLAQDLAPRSAQLLPFYTPTLFQAFASNAAEFVAQFRMVQSVAMQRAFARGEAVRELLQRAVAPEGLALVVDLPGPEAVAFAAGLQPAARAVFTFDNWPHPEGVVAAHETLAAAVYHRHDFIANGGNGTQPIVFVLDRNRLAAYHDEPGRFDNRYVAKLPGAESLRALGVTRVLYVVPAGVAAVELDDLNATFVAYRSAGTEVRMLGLGDLTEVSVEPSASQPTARSRYYWHGSGAMHWWFWNHYGWPSRLGSITPDQPRTASFGADYAPTRRQTMFDGVSRFGTTRLGGRSGAGTSGGSWSRASGGYHGGG